jgi:hypothetical protein
VEQTMRLMGLTQAGHVCLQAHEAVLLQARGIVVIWTILRAFIAHGQFGYEGGRGPEFSEEGKRKERRLL